MSFEGTWNIEINSPMGVQKAKGEFKVDGDKLTGTQSNPQGSIDVEGSVSGNQGTWGAQMSSPMPMKLEFNVTESGDTFEGHVKAGPFGQFPVKATRA